jgi:hypothetical protein
VLLPPERMRNVNWAERSVFVDMPREAVRSSPAYDPDQAFRDAKPKSPHAESPEHRRTGRHP